MNILIFSWRGIGHPNMGGAEIATHEHSKAWVRAGHHVTLFTSSYSSSLKKETLDGVNIIRYGNQFLAVHICGYFWYLFAKHPKYDIVVDQFHGIPFFTPLYVKTKILSYIHEVASQVWNKNEFRKPLNYIVSFLGPLLEPLIYKMYTKVDFLTVSNSTKNDLLNYGIKKQNIYVIYNGIKKVTRKVNDKNKTITYLGALTKDKGVEDAIKILAEVSRKDEGWKLQVIGHGDEEYVKYLKKLSQELGISGYVEFLGYVSEKKKYDSLEKSFCLINTSIHEGWGLVNIEANSVGTPVFAYNVKGIRDSVVDKKTGILADFGNYHQIALEIVKYSNNRKIYNDMVKNCLKWSKKYSWENSTKESLQLIESI